MYPQNGIKYGKSSICTPNPNPNPNPAALILTPNPNPNPIPNPNPKGGGTLWNSYLMDGIPLEEVDSYPYLGVEISNGGPQLGISYKQN